MSWLYENRRVWRVMILALFLMAIMGPWTFDLINVPSEYPCAIRLKGDFCGIPLSGMWMLAALASELIRLVTGLVMGTGFLPNAGRLFLLSLSALLLLLPLFSTLFLILRRDRQHQQAFHVAVWGLATLASFGLLISAPELPPSPLWGLWLYIGLAPAVLILEIGVLALRGRSIQATKFKGR